MGNLYPEDILPGVEDELLAPKPLRTQKLYPLEISSQQKTTLNLLLNMSEATEQNRKKPWEKKQGMYTLSYKGQFRENSCIESHVLGTLQPSWYFIYPTTLQSSYFSYFTDRETDRFWSLALESAGWDANPGLPDSKSVLFPVPMCCFLKMVGMMD